MTRRRPKIEPPLCNYCGAEARFFADSRQFYRGRNYGPVWACLSGCEAWVGCHPGTHRPLGRLANAELRAWKIKAHAAFDPLWTRKWRQLHAEEEARRGTPVHSIFGKGTARNAGYAWLSQQLGLPPEQTHIGMFDVEHCKKVVAICAPYLRNSDVDPKARRRGARTQSPPDPGMRSAGAKPKQIPPDPPGAPPPWECAA